MIIRKLTLFIIFVCQPNVLTSMGVQQDSKIYIQAIIGAILLFVICRKSDVKWERYILGLWVVLLLFRYFMGMLNEAVQYSMHLIIPALLSLALPDKISSVSDRRLYLFAFRLLMAYFFLEVGIGVYEYLTKTHVFLWVDSTYESHLYRIQNRPAGLSGSPLMNSWILAAINLCILFSSLRSKYKVMGFAVCLVGLLVYQGRMALLFSIIAFLLFIGKEMKHHKITLSQFAVIILIIGILYIALYQTQIGIRFVSTDDGGSAEMRFMALDYFFSRPISEFFFGMPYDTMRDVQVWMEVNIIECAFISQTLLFGLLFVVPFYILYFFLLWHIRMPDNKLKTIILYVLFFALINTGIGWFSGSYSLVVFYVVSKILSPHNLPYILPKKYVAQQKQE